MNMTRRENNDIRKTRISRWKYNIWNEKLLKYFVRMNSRLDTTEEISISFKA